METKMLTLTLATLNTITSEIEHTELEDGWSEGYELELKQETALMVLKLTFDNVPFVVTGRTQIVINGNHG